MRTEGRSQKPKKGLAYTSGQCKLENVAIANVLQLEAARRRAVPVRFNFVARVNFELALPYPLPS